MRCNKAGLSLIEQFEGLRLGAYRDIGGRLTIGYGHAMNVHPGDILTENQAELLLHQDVEKIEQGMASVIRPTISDNQWAAIVGFTYNLGIGTLMHSHLLEYVNACDFPGAAEEFLKWDHVNGQEVMGLLRRRLAEKALFERA